MIVAVLDACVLYSAPLRDFLMRLAVGLVFQPKWTERIHEEWIGSLLEKRPDLTRAQLERTRDLMNRYGRDWHAPESGDSAPSLGLPDPDDEHVLAAAISAGASVIVTFNLGDFPETILGPHGVCARHPDDFARDLLDEAPDVFLTAVREHRAALRKPPKSVEDYLATLAQCGLPRTARRLAAFHGEL